MFAHRLNDNTELRLLEPRHAEELFALVDANRAHLARHLSWIASRESADEIRGYIRHALHRLAEDGSPYCGIWHDGRLAGTIDMLGASGKKAEIGYWLDSGHAGRGLATLACRAMIGHAFHALDVRRVEIRSEPDNLRSCAVAERLGFTREGTLRQVINVGDAFHDCTVYSMLKHEWDGARETIAFSHPLTEEAELRLLLPHYAEEIYSLVDNNREHLRWMTFTEGTRSVEDIRSFIRHTLQEMAEGTGLHWAIVHDGRLAGIIGADGIDRNARKVGVGYWLAEASEGKGLMTRAGQALVAYLFNTAGLNRVEIRCDVRNTRSRAVAERLGVVYEGTKRQADNIGGEFVDMHYFGLLREEWEGQ